MSYSLANRCVKFFDQILFNYMSFIKYQVYQRERQKKKNQREFQKQQKKQRVALITNIENFYQYIFKKNQWSFQYFFVQQLVDANFYFKLNDKNKNLIRCYNCDLEIIEWNKSEKLYNAHLRFSLNCAWLKKYHEEFFEIKKYVCKRCLFKFFNNIKLHQHVHDYYQKKFKSTFFEVFTISEIFALIFTFDQTISSLFNEFNLFSKSFVISLFTSFFISSKILSSLFYLFSSNLFYLQHFLQYQKCNEHISNVTRRNDKKVLLLDTMKNCVITRNTF